MTKRFHRYDYEHARSERLSAERGCRWEEATYWLLQQDAVEQREIEVERHETRLAMEVIGIVVALTNLVCAGLMLWYVWQ